MLPLVLLGALVGTSYVVAVNRTPKKGIMTPARSVIYEAALTSEKDPKNLKELAITFRAEGLTLQADLLEKRAALKEVSPEIAEARQAAFHEMMKSDNPVHISEMAGEFEKIGATGSAGALRARATGLMAQNPAE